MFLILAFACLILLYIRSTKNFDYWKKRGVKYAQPLPFFGNSLKKYLQRISPTDQLTEVYKYFPNEKCVGGFESNHPVLILRDPELIKRVLITDFHYFNMKGMDINQTEPLMKNLFSVDGDMWRLLRQNLTLAFTTRKLKTMCPLILKQADKLQKIVSKAADNATEVNVRELMARYTIDVITTCGFGVDTDALNNNSSIFRRLGKRIFNITVRDALVFMSRFIAPELFIQLPLFASEIEATVTAIVRDIVKARNGKSSARMDIIDILLEMKNKERIVGQSLTKRGANGEPNIAEIVMDESLLIAQVFILFAAGYETSSSVTSFALYQLALHPEEQKKCQLEVDSVLTKHGKLTYDAIMDFKVLKRALDEAMRIYPPIGFLMRQCATKYTFEDINMKIDKGVTILIPVQALQNDEKYFPEPEVFRPDRFLPENFSQMTNELFLPFGAGPRICIGSRLGYLESLAGLAAILSGHTVIPSKSTRRHLTTDPTTALVQNIKGGIPLAFVSRSN